MTATTLLVSPFWSRAAAKPRAALIEVEAWAAPNGSYSLSAALGEARQAAALAQGADAVAAAGQDLVRIALVADVPDQDVLGRLEHMVQGDGQLDHAEAGAQVAAGDGHRVDGLGAQLVRQLTQLGDVEAAHVGGDVNCVEQGGVGHRGSEPWQA